MSHRLDSQIKVVLAAMDDGFSSPIVVAAVNVVHTIDPARMTWLELATAKVAPNALRVSC